MTYSVLPLSYTLNHTITRGIYYMDAIMIAGVAVVAIGGWYSALDLLGDIGVRIRRMRKSGTSSSGCFNRSWSLPAQRRVKQMAWVNI